MNRAAVHACAVPPTRLTGGRGTRSLVWASVLSPEPHGWLS
jgi:hypothetical protein